MEETKPGMDETKANDSVRLLRECNAGIKMGIAAIDDVLPKVKDTRLKTLLTEMKADHESLETDTQRLLATYHDPDKEPSPIAKGMSWLKTNVKMMTSPRDETVADLMTDGCHMGIKSLSRYLNQYTAADGEVQHVTRRLIDLEENMAESLRRYL